MRVLRAKWAVRRGGRRARGPRREPPDRQPPVGHGPRDGRDQQLVAGHRVHQGRGVRAAGRGLLPADGPDPAAAGGRGVHPLGDGDGDAGPGLRRQDRALPRGHPLPRPRPSCIGCTSASSSPCSRATPTCRPRDHHRVHHAARRRTRVQIRISPPLALDAHTMTPDELTAVVRDALLDARRPDVRRPLRPRRQARAEMLLGGPARRRVVNRASLAIWLGVLAWLTLGLAGYASLSQPNPAPCSP